MLPGIGGSELIVIGIVALIVVGPKDLPKMLRQLGRFVGKMRNMADDFRTAFDDMARQSELDDLRKEVEALRQNQPLEAVGQQMKSIGADIQTGLNAASSRPSYASPPSEPDISAVSIHDPQLDGLPPGSAPVMRGADEAPPAIVTDGSEPDVVMPVMRAKKVARPRKLAEPAPVEVVEAAPPARKPRAKKATQSPETAS